MGATAVAVGALFALIAGQIELGLCLFSLLGGAGGYVIKADKAIKWCSTHIMKCWI